MEFEEFSFEPCQQFRGQYQNNDIQQQKGKDQICLQASNQFHQQHGIQNINQLKQNYNNQYPQIQNDLQNPQIQEQNYQVPIQNISQYGEYIENEYYQQNYSQTNLPCESNNSLNYVSNYYEGNNLKCSSNTLCLEQQNINSNQQEQQPTDLSFIQINWDEQIDEESNQDNCIDKVDDQLIPLKNNNKPKNSIQIQKIAKFKFPDMKYETSQLNYRENYYLIGDLFISINMYLDGDKKNRDNKQSLWNQIRPVDHIENRNKFISIIVDDTKAGIEDFDRIIGLLNKQNSYHAQQQSKWLVQYKQYLYEHQKIKDKIFDEYSHNISLIKQKLTQNTIESLKIASEILDKQFSGANDYILYTYRRNNAENLSLTLYKGGLSQAMMKLIYIDEENFRVDTLRNGMLELFSYEGYESVNYSYIFGNMQPEIRKQKRNFTLFTIDDLEVNFEMEEFAIPLAKVSLSEGCWFSDQMRVYKFTINPYQLAQLQIMRNMSSNLIGKNYQQTQYFQQSGEFVQKFYKTPQSIKQ